MQEARPLLLPLPRAGAELPYLCHEAACPSPAHAHPGPVRALTSPAARGRGSCTETWSPVPSGGQT